MSKRFWTRPGVPHTGWKHVRNIENATASGICEMCGQKSIKYLDVLIHDNYGDEIEVGKDCSLLMRIPGNNGFRWPGTDILILENENTKQFGIIKGNKAYPERFSSLEEAQKWAIDNSIYL
jgi:hypothetical protein